jgi:hypothetical protein
MLSLVWDFGQLDSATEEQYIRQMAAKHVNNASNNDNDYIHLCKKSKLSYSFTN